ncbi:hypothetical protein ACFQ7A_16685 [Streptomyces sp. NPDC056528]|uniref:hypothetical protein n=1 Tax=Streptomyces sp. NPDC056528 TaxID=3345854 RepID=UPI0036B0F6AF
MSQPTLSAVVAGSRSTLSETARLVRRSTAFDLAATVDLDRGDEEAESRLSAFPGADLVVLDAVGAERLRLIRRLREARKAVLLADPFPLPLGELDQLLGLQAAGGPPIGVLAPHRALLDGFAPGSLPAPFTCGVLEVSDYRPAEAHRWARWAPLAEDRAAQAALRSAAPYLDLACQLLGEPEAVRAPGPDDGTRVGTVDFAGGCRFTFAMTSRSSSHVERLDLLGRDARLRIEGGRASLEQDFAVRTAELPSLISACELLLHEMASAIRAVGRLRYGSLAAGRGLAMILEELGK